MAEKKVVKSFLYGALAGAVTGAVTALLFAPKKGSELRKDIKDTAQTVGEKTVEISRMAGSTAQNIVKRSGDWASEIRSKLSRKEKEETEAEAASEESAAQ
ncbi:YtxH domain-containing protein [Cohnella lubricantis]|uniref:YtxH domain-containing protein n=1 Tax=Cohnella lubricantis TaxID=2163172 RepID=A0A841TJ97_9BACL|nr:YtxH domain-containing protein [Cohnella lubricantis]MBB6679308.1 YtxH domain-containing protein [Cohnella lubricantis]MBP2120383.1 gas vesicle protein [Cohnella lubricantis]